MAPATAVTDSSGSKRTRPIPELSDLFTGSRDLEAVPRPPKQPRLSTAISLPAFSLPAPAAAGREHGAADGLVAAAALQAAEASCGGGGCDGSSFACGGGSHVCCRLDSMDMAAAGQRRPSFDWE
jgi:hypothetical protein